MNGNLTRDLWCKGTKQLRLDPTIYEAILKEKITVGDVVYIEANSGAVKVITLISLSSLNSCLYCFVSASVVQTPMRLHTIWNPKPTFLFQRERFIKRRS